MQHTIIGTAGHIDHGKTVLVKALTGMDTDRLKEEKERGITIDLGFAFLGEHVTIIDVPGHERFIKNMVAGVSTIDLVLFVVAADDGVMPQTREHMDILELLQVKRGIIVLTKKDLVDEEWLELVEEDVQDLVAGTFLEDVPVVAVSAVTGGGLQELRARLEEVIAQVTGKTDSGIFRLPVDRAFTMKGFGTVATGSVLSGSVRVGDTVALLPTQRDLRIRGLQTHGQDVETVEVGDRAAINLVGAEHREIKRGDVLADPGYFKPTFLLDGRLQLLRSCPRPMKNRTRVRLHLGTDEIMARVVLLEGEEFSPGASALVQLRLESPGVASRQDRFVIRQYSPELTIGGGVVLDANPIRHRRFDSTVLDSLVGLEKEEPEEILEEILRISQDAMKSVEDLAAESGTPKEIVTEQLADLEAEGKIVILGREGRRQYFYQANWEVVQQRILETLAAFHRDHPLRDGLKRDELKNMAARRWRGSLFENALDGLVHGGKVKAVGPTISLFDHQIRFTPDQEDLRNRIEAILLKEGFSTSDEAGLSEEFGERADRVKTVLDALQSLGVVLRLEESVLFHAEKVAEAKDRLVQHLKGHGQITVAEFRDLIGTTRKYVLPLLNYFDRSGITERKGDVRVLK